MAPAEGRDAQSLNRRRWRRVKLSVPVQVGKGAEGVGALSEQHAGWSKSMSPGGVYVTTREGGSFVPGELLRVSVSVPWESRKVFPFAWLAGSGRVVRVEDLSTPEEGRQTGLAIEFFEDMTVLGAIVTP